MIGAQDVQSFSRFTRLTKHHMQYPLIMSDDAYPGPKSRTVDFSLFNLYWREPQVSPMQ